MASAGTSRLLKRALVALAAGVALLAVATAALALYADRRLARAERRYLDRLEEQVWQPPRSSGQSLRRTEGFLAAAATLSRDRRSGAGPAEEPGPRLAALLSAADGPLAHEPLDLGGDDGLALLAAARLLERTAGDAAERGDEPLQVRCAEALAAVADACYRRTSLLGLLLGSAVELLELEVVRRLVETPRVSAAAVERLLALLDRPRPPLQASWAGEALALVGSEPPPPEHPWLAPLQHTADQLLEARTLERLGAFAGELDRPLVEFLAADPAWVSGSGPLDVLANMLLPNTRDAIVKAKSVEEVRRLGREALRRRQSGGSGQLTRPEALAALHRYWNVPPGETLPPGPSRLRALLTWRLPA